MRSAPERQQILKYEKQKLKVGKRTYDDVLIPEMTEEEALLRIAPTLENTEAITLKTTEVRVL